MYKFIPLLFVALLLQFYSVAAAPIVFDSVRVENRNGKTFVVHKVEPKETLYALSRKYKVAIDLIVDANTNLASGLKVGQLVFIPRKYSVLPVAPAATFPAEQTKTSRTYTVNGSGQKIHVVEPKQTVYSLSRMYKVSPDEIKRWNHLPSDNIRIGDSLIVGQNSKTSKAPIYVPEADDAVTPEKASVSEPAVAPVAGIPENVSLENNKAKEGLNTEAAKADSAKVEIAAFEKNDPEAEPSIRTADDVGKVVETGLAEVIDQQGEVNKYLALHKTAPVGTILQVKNIMNGQIVYVRVIGSLPPTGSNEKVIVRISKKAYQKLAAIDNRFRVELAYMP